MRRMQRPTVRALSSLSPGLSALAVMLLVVLLGGAQPAGGATPVLVQAQLTPAEIYFGDSTILELRIIGLRDPAPPTLRHPDIDITREGGQSFNNTSHTTVNGQEQRLEEFGYLARYRLRPRTDGTLTVPPLTVTHDGQTYRSKPVQLLVRRAPQQEHMRVEVYTAKPTYVLGESVTLALDISIRKLTANGTILDADPFFREQPPHVQIPWFESLGDWKTTDVNTFIQPLLGLQRPGFAINNYRRDGVFQSAMLTFTLPRQPTRRHTSNGTADYFTYQLRKLFWPTRAGVQAIPPVLMKAVLPLQVDARGRPLHTETVVASSAPFNVTVRPIPGTGQPASFSGAVGRFTLEVDANPKLLKVGDPLTLTVTLHGEGLLDTIRPPLLHQQPALQQDFKVQTDPPAVKTDANAKTFTYTIRPRQAGVRAIPALDMAYFDPDAQRYHVLHSTPIPLRVEDAAALTVADVVTADTNMKSTMGQELAAGILANYTGPEVLVPQHFQIQVTPLAYGILALPPLAYVFTLLWPRIARRQQRYPERQRARQAPGKTRQALRALRVQRLHDETALGNEVHRILTSYFRAKLHLDGAGLTVDDVTRHLQAQGVAHSVIEQVAAVLNLCDSARYAPGSLAVAQLNGLVEDTEALVQRLEESLRR